MADNDRKRPADAIDLTEEPSPREKKQKVALADIAKEFICPITQELPFDPAMAQDGKIYERAAILEWFRKKDGDATSPSTGKVIDTELVPAVQVRNTIESLIKSGAIEGEIAEAWKIKLEQETKVKEMRAKAEGGDGYAMFMLGAWYGSGLIGLAKDEVQARAWYELSAEARHPKGMAMFSSYLLRGIGGPQDNVFGIMNLAQAAELGSDYGAYILGHAFFSGDGLPKDPVRARYWLKKAVDGECEFKLLFHDDRSAAEQMLEALESGGGVIS